MGLVKGKSNRQTIQDNASAVGYRHISLSLFIFFSPFPPCSPAICYCFCGLNWIMYFLDGVRWFVFSCEFCWVSY